MIQWVGIEIIIQWIQIGMVMEYIPIDCMQIEVVPIITQWTLYIAQ